MNFLAHCLLSCSEEDLLIGNVITDFIKKNEVVYFNESIQKGIELHKSIDQFTDTHVASLQLRNILRPRHDKYAPVVVDLIWDYFLSKKWSHYSGQKLTEFCSEVYNIISLHINELPVRLQSKFIQLIEDDFLMAYGTDRRMESSLEWMDNRVKFKSAFYKTPLDIKENYNQIEQLFDQFFPELVAHSEEFCNCQ